MLIKTGSDKQPEEKEIEKALWSDVIVGCQYIEFWDSWYFVASPHIPFVSLFRSSTAGIKKFKWWSEFKEGKLSLAEENSVITRNDNERRPASHLVSCKLRNE